MIERKAGFYELSCDFCGDICDEMFDSFYEAVEYKKENDTEWKSINTSGVWDDACPDCAESHNNPFKDKKF